MPIPSGRRSRQLLIACENPGRSIPIEAPDACVAAAAAEVVAAAIDAPAADLPNEVSDWVSKRRGKVTPDHNKNAYEAVVRVAERSEFTNPRGYCPDHSTGVSCPIGLAVEAGGLEESPIRFV